MLPQFSRIALLVSLFALPSLPVARTSAEPPSRTDVFVSGTEGYHTFRIPSIIVTKRGTLLATCEGRKTGRGDHGDLDLVIKRSFDGGETWDKMQTIYEEGGDAEITIGNPCPVIDDSTGTIWMPFCRNNKEVLISKSVDDGTSWSKPVNISGSVVKSAWTWVATGPGVGIQLKQGPHKGRLVIPCDHGIPMDGSRVMYSHVFYSDDHGESWSLGGSLDRHTDECQVVELADGTLKMNARNYWGRQGGRPDRGNMRAISQSTDGGDTWSKLEFDRVLIEPICQGSFLRYPGSGTLLLFSNPASREARQHMTVRLSENDGTTWPVARLLHAGPAAYSCLAVLPDGSVACLFENGTETAYEKITFARFPLGWLKGSADR